MNVEELRQKYPRFIYKDFHIQHKKSELMVSFDFEIEAEKGKDKGTHIFFKPQLKIQISRTRFEKIPKALLNNLIFHLGLMEIPSYWKVTCSPSIEVRSGKLKEEQIRWWKDLITKGMAQYFYENKINFKKANFLNIKSAEGLMPGVKQFEPSGPPRFLLAMGEGKDSIVALEFLKKIQKVQKKERIELNCFVVNPNKIHFKILKQAGIKKPIIIERKIDQKLLELNRKGFLNGHTPVTALNSFLAVFAAAVFGFNNVVFANERSANEGNLKYQGEIINHQYSKSFEFERKFSSYIKSSLTAEINYFSLLRPFSELQLAKIFADFPGYFSLFLSCNEAKKTYSGRKKASFRWCGQCPKCLFVFSILYPFLEEKDLMKIFGENLFAKRELRRTVLRMIGKTSHKPFECVGAQKESLIALYLSWEKARPDAGKLKLPFLLDYFEKKIMPKYPNLKETAEKILQSWSKQNNVPEDLRKFLKHSLAFI